MTMLDFRQFLLPKAGYSSGECEDAVCASKEKGRFAVADGATEAFDSRRWARMLTKAWVLSRSISIEPGVLLETLSRMGVRLDAKWENRDLPWYAQEKRLSGAYAAFAGLAFEDSEQECRWLFVGLGDCCMFHERDGKLVESIPYVSPEEFGYSLVLVPAKMPDNLAKLYKGMRIRNGIAVEGDVFLLVSDALACWYLRHAVGNAGRRRDFHYGLRNGIAGEFMDLVTQERSTGSLRNDDVAVVRIEIVPNQ